MSTLNPVNASNKKVSWTSSDPATVEVTGGAIKGLKLGNATITVTTADGSHTASCAVSVKAVKSIAVAGTAKYWYERDEEFSTDGLTLEVSYEDGVSGGGIPITSEMISAPYHWNRGLGSRAITITYGGKSTDIAVVVREVTQVVLSGRLARVHYGYGEEFDPAGLYFTAIFNDGPNYGPKPVEASMAFPANWNAEPASNANQGTAPSLEINYHGKSSGAIGTTNLPLAPTTPNTIGVWPLILRRPTQAPVGYRADTKYDAASPAAGEALYDAGGLTATLTYHMDVPLTASQAYTLSELYTDLTLEGFGKDRLLTAKSGDTNGVFVLKNGTKLTLGNHIIMQGLTGAAAPLVQVDDTTRGSIFTMKSGSKIQAGASPSAATGVGLLEVAKGKAIIEKGAEIIGGIVSGTVAAGDVYVVASAVLVRADGSLIMNGGKITGNITGGTKGGVGDVVVLGNLELGGDAYIKTLALAGDSAAATPRSMTFANPVTINAGWAPPADLGTIKLNLSGSEPGTNPTTVGNAIKYFDSVALFKPGAGVTTDTMGKFVLGDIFFNKSLIAVVPPGTSYTGGRGDGSTITGNNTTYPAAPKTTPPHDGQDLNAAPAVANLPSGYDVTHYAKSAGTPGSSVVPKSGFNLTSPNVGQLNWNR